MTADNLVLILCAVIIDSIIGDPVFSLHPVRLIGKLIQCTEKVLRKSGIPESRGGYLGLVFVITVPLALLAAIYLVFRTVPYADRIITVLVIYFSIALKDLARHGLRVKTALEAGNIKEAGKRVSYLVTRDTEKMGEIELIKCTVESISENAGDSVIAPLFWALLFGAPGALFYRTVNTLDAMWGYRTSRYIRFGKPAAVLDDILNFIPSRITGILFCLCAPVVKGNIITAFKTMVRDHGKVKSPNAGFPEAAMAGALGISLGGTGIYFGKEIKKETMGRDLKEHTPERILSAIKLLYLAAFIFLSVPLIFTLVM